MPKEEWGVKRVCPNCSTRFYDLQRDPMTCPSCNHTFSAESLSIGRGRTLVADKSDAKRTAADVAAQAALVDDEDDDVVLEDDDDDDDDDLADDVLEDDDDDDVSLDDIADVAKEDDD